MRRARAIRLGAVTRPLAAVAPRLPYTAFVGGVVMVTKQQFSKVNGYSNRFFGWGGESDDFYNR